MLPDQSSTGDRDLRLLIDDAVLRLPAGFRAAIVTCYLEGLTHEEAAARLRCPVGTIRSRLARGRALLRDRLERSGLTPGVRQSEPLAMLVAGRAQSSVSSRLLDTTARSAARLAAGDALAAIVPARLAQLVAGASSTMSILKVTMTTSLIFGGLAACGALIMAAQTPGDLAPHGVCSRRDRATVDLGHGISRGGSARCRSNELVSVQNRGG